MRLDAVSFLSLRDLSDFVDYYETLNADEMIDELDRLHTKEPPQILLNQYFSFLVTSIDISCNNTALSEIQRSAFIGICGNVRANIYDIILPLLPSERKSAVDTAISATEDRMARFGFYPRAVDMILVQARKPTGPYELGTVGEILAKHD